MGWFSRLFKKTPPARKAFDVSNWWHTAVTDIEAGMLMQKAKAAGYSVVMCETYDPAICQQQIKAAIAIGLLVDVYPYIDFSLTPTQNIDNVFTAIAGTGFNGLVWLDFEAEEDLPVDVFSYVDSCVKLAWERGLRPGIYTRRLWWTTHMNDLTSFSYLALWDANPDGVATNNTFKQYGGWPHPVWKQYAFNQNLGGMNADLSVEWSG